MPVLAEAVEGGDHDDDLEDAEDHDQGPDQRRGERRFVEAGLVAGEPAFGADRAEDRQDRREGRGDRQDAAVPAGDEEGEEGVEDRVDRADDSHAAATFQQRPAADRDQGRDHRRGGKQQHDHELGRDRPSLLPIRPPQFVARPDLSNRHGTIIESTGDVVAFAAR